MTQARRRISPKGKCNPIMTVLKPDERVRIEELADSEMRSLSSTVRMLMLRGLETYPNAAPAPTNPTVQ